jgi:hypothetical protein
MHITEVSTMTDLDVATNDDRCPYCGRERTEWTENDGHGVAAAGLTYCSQDCLARDQARG